MAAMLPGMWSMKAKEFIPKYCKGSVNREFPSEWLEKTVQEIKQAADQGNRRAQTAWKLLSRREYRK